MAHCFLLWSMHTCRLNELHEGIIHEESRGSGVLLVVLAVRVAASPVTVLLLRLRDSDKAVPVRSSVTQGVCSAHTQTADGSAGE